VGLEHEVLDHLTGGGQLESRDRAFHRSPGTHATVRAPAPRPCTDSRWGGLPGGSPGGVVLTSCGHPVRGGAATVSSVAQPDDDPIALQSADGPELVAAAAVGFDVRVRVE